MKDRPVAEISDNTYHLKETDSHLPAIFEPVIPTSEGPQTNSLDRVADGIGPFTSLDINNQNLTNASKILRPAKLP